ncbi:hypothetical protein ACF08N_17875 [Streptomyces sp. NPDC015127]|uniref:hypothetical protein n=1 Tax=Streptomyces sp. NPDC015127 TaxID=3364939 RepID=UPI0036F9C4BD
MLTATERAAAIKGAQVEAATTAKAIGLSGKEKLVAREVVEDADGTVHTSRAEHDGGGPGRDREAVGRRRLRGEVTGRTT